MELSGFLVSALAQRVSCCLLAAVYPDTYSDALATCCSLTVEVVLITVVYHNSICHVLQANLLASCRNISPGAV